MRRQRAARLDRRRSSTDGRFADTVNATDQTALTPTAALDLLVAGNRRFVADRSRVDNFAVQRTATAAGQAPFATVLACIDSRSAPETVFDLAIGDIFAPRIAGNIVTTEMLGSIEFSTKLAGSKLVVVMGHKPFTLNLADAKGVRPPAG